MVAQSTTQGGTPRQSATGKQRHRMNTWQLDTAHTSVSFTAKHMMITKVRGAFNGVTGTIKFD
jgi:polyisoprenoid-binding protein YceI